MFVRAICCTFAIMKRNALKFILFVMLSMVPALVVCQNATRLMEYPEVPDRLTKPNLRADYMIEHLWDNVDLEKTAIADRQAFVDAFTDYLSMFAVADVPEVEKAVAKFVNRIQKNSSNLQLLQDALEVLVYDPRSQYCSDDVYQIFGAELAKCKAVDAQRRRVIEQRVSALKNSRKGATVGGLTLRSGDRQVSIEDLTSDCIILIVNVEGNFDTNFLKIRLGADLATQRLVENGAVSIISVYDKSMSSRSGDEPNWYVAEVSNVDGLFDTRVVPAVYVLDKARKIVTKFPTDEQLLTIMARLANTMGV